jgi:carboxypeptidase family protein
MKYALKGLSFILLFFVILALLPSAHVNAQVTKGSISGIVEDPQGAVVPGAEIKAINKDTGEAGNTVSDDNGLFRINLLSVGNYTLQISKQGFRQHAVTGVIVNSATITDLGALRLEIGELSASVEVTEAAPLVESTQAQVSANFTSSNITTLPGVLENQGLDNLALFIPGVASTGDLNNANTNGVGFAVEGLRGRTNDQQIDGQNNNDNSVTGPSIFLSDPEFVQEYQVTTNNFGAEYGRNSGSVVNILTKSGTNTVHGSIYGTEGNSGFDALTNNQKAFEGLTQVPHYNDSFVGATIGGPMVKDKLFYFGGFDTEIIPQKSVYSTGALTPTPAGIGQLETCFGQTPSLLDLAKYGPYGVSAGNPTPQSPKLYTVGTCATQVEMGGVQRTLTTGYHSYNWLYKMDLNTEKNHFYGRYIYNKSTPFNANSFGTAAAGYPNSVPALSQGYGFSWVRVISLQMSNEFRATYGRANVGFGGNSIGNTVPTITSISNALANVTMGSGNLGFGPATTAPQGRIINTYQLQDNWTFIKGRHALKAGANFTYQRSPNYFLPNYNGSFSFTSWANFAQNLPSSVSITSGNPVLDFREHDTFLYAQDDFKLKSNLTLTMGLTWSYYGQPATLFHDHTTAQQTGSSPYWNPSLPLSVTTFPSIPAPKASFGPNVGFAWTPEGSGWLLGKGKTTIRGGYRYAYDPPFYNIYLNIASAAPNVLAQTISTNPPGLILDPFGPAVRSALGSYLVFGVKDPRSFNQTTVAPDFGPQKTSRWSFGIQREIVPAAVVEVRYVGNHATNLFQSINGNPYIAGIAADFPNLLPSGVTPCSSANAVVASAVGRVNCNLGVVRERTNSAYSDYNGVETEIRTNNLWKQLTMRASYTFSKTTDNADEIYATNAAGSAIAFSQNPLDYTKGEHGISGLNFPHRFTILAAEQLPFYRGQHGLIGHVLGGWALGAAYVISSGQPYTAVQYALNYGSGYQDVAFNRAFAGNYDGGARPFLATPSAPMTQVGIYAADACNNFATTGLEPYCNIAPDTLLSMNGFNQAANLATYNPSAISKNSVRFIANGPEADSIFGTPFGNVARNTLRTNRTNNVNLTVFKTINFWERTKLEFHLTAINAFNHPQFTTVDPFLDDAGSYSEFTGFAVPTVQNGGSRSIRIGLTIRF